MDVNRDLKRYERVIRSAAIKYAAGLLAQRPNEYDDVMNEARIAAWRAIERYNVERKTKIETFIFNCVRNKMIDLARHANRLGRNLTVPVEDVDQHGDDSASAQIDHDILLKQVLSEDELSFIDALRRGGGVVRFISELGRMTGVKSDEATKEVSECLHRIQRKLESQDQSQNVLTLKRRSKPPREGTL
jgi:RNA polymerase sigma factor (sigma-70 family)